MPKNWPPDEAADLVRRIYRQVLERQVDDSGMMTWGGFLDRGEKSIREVIRLIGKSAEYQRRFVIEVSLLEAAKLMYKHFLARDPENDTVMGGWAAHIAQHGWQSAVDGFLNSEEYMNRFGENAVPA